MTAPQACGHQVHRQVYHVAGMVRDKVTPATACQPCGFVALVADVTGSPSSRQLARYRSIPAATITGAGQRAGTSPAGPVEGTIIGLRRRQRDMRVSSSSRGARRRVFAGPQHSRRLSGAQRSRATCRAAAARQTEALGFLAMRHSWSFAAVDRRFSPRLTRPIVLPRWQVRETEPSTCRRRG